MVVVVAELICAGELFSRRFSLLVTVSKFVPFTVTAVPVTAVVGVKLVIVGTPLLARTLNDVLLVADPVGVVTPIAPVVALVGTLATSCVAVADVTDAVVPLNVMVFWLGVVLKPVS